MSLRSGMSGIWAPAWPAVRRASSLAYRAASGSARRWLIGAWPDGGIDHHLSTNSSSCLAFLSLSSCLSSIWRIPEATVVDVRLRRRHCFASGRVARGSSKRRGRDRPGGGRGWGAAARTVCRMDVISCEGLTKRFGSAIVVNGLDLAVSSGQVYVFGRRCLQDHDHPDAAGPDRAVRGPGLSAWPAPSRPAGPGAGLIIEEPAFYPWMTGRMNLKCSVPRGWLRSRRGRPGPSPGPPGDVAARKVKTYSQGMRQRLGIAAAMLGRPSLLIIDEPTNGLDPAGIRDIRGLLRGLAAEGTTVFLSSHLLAEVEQVCDRVAVIVDRRLVEEGAPAMLGAIRRRVRVEVRAADSEAARPAAGPVARQARERTVPRRARQRPGRERRPDGRLAGTGPNR